VPRPPPPSGKFLPVEIRALRAVLDSLGDTKFPNIDPRYGKTAAVVALLDYYERAYPPLYVLARHGVDRVAATRTMWRDYSAKQKRLRLPDGSYILLDDQDVADLARVRNRYPHPAKRTKFMIGSAVHSWLINPRVMERWACRADLRRDPVRYEDLVLGFSALDATRFQRLTLPEDTA
jgi:hypothetical protein